MGATGAAEPPGLYRVTRIVLHQQTNNNNNNHPLQVNSHSSLPWLCSLGLLPRLCCPGAAGGPAGRQPARHGFHSLDDILQDKQGGVSPNRYK